MPAVGDRVLVMRQPWLDLVLSGEKTLELRATRHALGRVWVGMGGKVYGGVTIAGSRVLSEAEFYELADQHLWPRDAALPYEARLRAGLDCAAAPGGADPVLAPARRRRGQRLPEDGRGRPASTAYRRRQEEAPRERAAARTVAA